MPAGSWQRWSRNLQGEKGLVFVEASQVSDRAAARGRLLGPPS